MTSLSHGGSAAVDRFSLGTLKDSLPKLCQCLQLPRLQLLWLFLFLFATAQSHALKGNAGDVLTILVLCPMPGSK